MIYDNYFLLLEVSNQLYHFNINVYEKTYSILILEHEPVLFRTRQECIEVKVFGADESPAQFKDAFRRINELFITEAKKYNVGKQLKKEVTEISLDAVNQVNENIDLAELMTAKREYTLSKEQIKAAINALPIQKTPGVGMVFIAQFLDKSNNRGTYEVVFFNTETKEIIEEWITDGKARGFGLRNYWAGSIYSALKKL